MKNTKSLDLSWHIVGLLLSLAIAIASYTVSSIHIPSVHGQSIDCYVSQNFLPHVASNRMVPTSTPVEKLWEEEPNETPNKATGPVKVGTNYYGYPNDQTDYFYFDMTTNGEISITLENLSGSGRQLILYYQSPDNPVVSDDEEPFQIVRGNRPAGRYLVRIYVESNHNTTTPYTLRVNYPVASAQTASLESMSDPLPKCTPTNIPVIPTDTPMATQTPTSTNTVTPSPTSTPTTTTPAMGWCDNFNDGLIDQSKWLLPADSSLLYEQDGVMNFRVTQAQSQAGNVDPVLESILLGKHVGEVTFTIALESFIGNIPGAAGPAYYLEDGRELSVDVGPGGPNGPAFEFSLCRTPTCKDYEDYFHPDGGDFPVGTRVPMKMTWTGESLKFYINDELRIEPSTLNNPITGFLFSMYADPNSAYHVTVDDVCVKYAEPSVPTATPTGTPTPTAQVGYNFETNIQNWTTSEGDFKYTRLDTTTQYVYSGARALRLTTDLRLDADAVLRHTEAVVYFTPTPPEGIASAGPYNLTGNFVSCLVYLPAGLAPSDSSGAYIRLFVKDAQSHNQYANSVNISSANVNSWFPLALTVGEGGGADPDFDSTKINALGIRVDLHEGATLKYVGPLFIDHCTIEYP